MVVKFDHNVIVSAGQYGAETKLSVLNLRSLCIRLFVGHGDKFSYAIVTNRLRVQLTIEKCVLYNGFSKVATDSVKAWTI
jgi:hypothetical protein